MTEPTPGTWVWHWAVDDNGHADGRISTDLRSYDTGFQCCIAVSPRYQTKEQWEADARLIAAAPTMLAILERIVLEESLGASFIPDLTLSLIRAIIVQATGEDLS